MNNMLGIRSRALRRQAKEQQQRKEAQAAAAARTVSIYYNITSRRLYRTTATIIRLGRHRLRHDVAHRRITVVSTLVCRSMFKFRTSLVYSYR